MKASLVDLFDDLPANRSMYIHTTPGPAWGNQSRNDLHIAYVNNK